MDWFSFQKYVLLFFKFLIAIAQVASFACASLFIRSCRLSSGVKVFVKTFLEPMKKLSFAVLVFGGFLRYKAIVNRPRIIRIIFTNLGTVYSSATCRKSN